MTWRAVAWGKLGLPRTMRAHPIPRLGLLLALALAPAACAEEPPPAPAPAPAPPPPAPAPQRDPTCDRICDRMMSCELGELGDRQACMRRCFARSSRDAPSLACLAEPTPDGSRRCDLARRCVELEVERPARPAALEPERGRLDARALGPDVEISLEARLVSALPEASRYDLVLLLRGRAGWDGGLGAAGEGVDAGLDAGLAAPDRWVRIGGFESDGQLPLLRIAPSEASEPDGPLFEHASYWAGAGDRYRIRVQSGALVVEHAFEDNGLPDRRIAQDLQRTLTITLAPSARVRAARVLVE